MFEREQKVAAECAAVSAAAVGKGVAIRVRSPQAVHRYLQQTWW